MKGAVFPIFLFLSAFAQTEPSVAAPGDLDLTFGDSGHVLTNLSEDAGASVARAVVVQPDGRILVGGYSVASAGGSYFALARFQSDGSPDLSFGGDGEVYTNLAGSHAQLRDLLLQGDGKIVAIGHAPTGGGGTPEVAAVRYNSDGSLDSGFADNGVFLLLGSGSGSGQAGAIQGDGKILIASEEPFDFRVVRLFANGSLDNGFGDAGVLDLDFGSDDGARDIALQADGKIVLVGEEFEDCAVARLHSDGSYDSSFSGDGKLTTNINFCELLVVAVQPDGKILAAGHSSNADRDLLLIRYLSDGTLDSTFGSGNGFVNTDLGGIEEVSSLTLQADGKIVVTAISLSENAYDFAVLRYETTGELDPGFDADGIALLDTVEGGDAYAVAMQSDGKIIVAGEVRDDLHSSFALARFQPGGVLDSGFADGGFFETAMGPSNDGVSSVTVRDDGRVVMTGIFHRTTPYGSSITLAASRYLDDGTIDTSFHSDGIATAPLAGAQSASSFLSSGGVGAVQPDGKVVVAGAAPSEQPSHYPQDFSVVRFDTDGSLDESFGSDGLAAVELSTVHARVGALALQSDGAIVVAGHARPAFSQAQELALLRLTASGDPDPAFGGGDGIVTTPIGDTFALANALVVQPDGKILAAGYWTHRGTIEGFVVVRYLPDGTLDPEFGTNGFVTTSIGNGDELGEGMVLQPDGKIIVVGSDELSEPAGSAAVVRYNPDGLLDKTFDVDGMRTLPFASGGENSIALQADGRILVSQGSSFSTSSIARLEVDGRLDTSFGADGYVEAPPALEGLEHHSMHVQDDGRIVVASTLASRLGTDLLLTRYLGDDCGNASLDTDEQCDDGNLLNEDGCSAACRFEPCGPSPAVDCRVGVSTGRSKLLLKDHPDDLRDSFSWTWSTGETVDASELGDPLATDDYWVCVWDNGVRVSSTLIPHDGDCPAGNCWRERPDGFAYKSKSDLPEGATRLQIVAAGEGDSALRFRGRGVSLDMPAAATLSGPLVVQLHRGDGDICWSSTFPAPFREQEGIKLVAIGD